MRCVSNMKCKRCNKKISENSFNCTYCGYLTNKGKSVLTLIIIFVIFIIFILFIKILNKTNYNEILGEWSYVGQFVNEKNFSNELLNGTETITYSFSSNGTCVSSYDVVGTKSKKHYNIKTKQWFTETEPYTISNTDACKYKVKNDGNTIEIFFYKEFEEDLSYYDECMQTENCTEETPDKNDYIEEYDLTITEYALIIDGDKYSKIN